MLAIYPHPLLWSSSQLGRVLLADFDIQYFLWHTGILYTVLARVPFPIVIPSPFECFVFGQSRTMTTVTVCGIPPANICQSFNISSHHPTGRGIRCCRAWCTVHAPAQSTGETLRPRHSTSSNSLLRVLGFASTFRLTVLKFSSPSLNIWPVKRWIYRLLKYDSMQDIAKVLCTFIVVSAQSALESNEAEHLLRTKSCSERFAFLDTFVEPYSINCLQGFTVLTSQCLFIDLPRWVVQVSYSTLLDDLLTLCNCERRPCILHVLWQGLFDLTEIVKSAICIHFCFSLVSVHVFRVFPQQGMVILFSRSLQ